MMLIDQANNWFIFYSFLYHMRFACWENYWVNKNIQRWRRQTRILNYFDWINVESIRSWFSFAFNWHFSNLFKTAQSFANSIVWFFCRKKSEFNLREIRKICKQKLENPTMKHNEHWMHFMNASAVRSSICMWIWINWEFNGTLVKINWTYLLNKNRRWNSRIRVEIGDDMDSRTILWI